MIQEFTVSNQQVKDFEDCIRFTVKYSLKKYFNRIINHIDDLYHDFCQEDSMYIFIHKEALRRAKIPRAGAELQIKEVVEVSFTSDEVRDLSGSIFDGIEALILIPAPVEIWARTGGDTDRIEFPVIKYFPEQNIAFTLDISHSMQKWEGHEEDLDKIMEVFFRYLKPIKKKLIVISRNPIKMGADTEVEVVRNHRVVYAQDELDICIDDYLFRASAGEVGIDGSHEVAEIRPKPEEDPLKLLENHYDLLDMLHQEGYTYNLNTRKYPCGMHLHFSCGEDSERLKKLFPQVVAPLISIAGKINLPQQEVRNNFHYGSPSDWRLQPWGAEYRAFPSVILAVPDMAEKFFVGTYDIVSGICRTGKVKVNTKWWKEFFDELLEKVDRTYLFANKPIVDTHDEKLATYLEQRMLEELRSPYPIVSFYTLHSKRGLVTAGLATSLTKEVEHPSENTARKIFRFGIPYKWRNNIPEEVFPDIFQAIKTNIEASVEVSAG